MSFQSFTRENQLILPTSPRLSYYRRTFDNKKSIHWGQRKLLLSEIQFLTLFWDPNTVPKPIILYAGASPGTHIPFLLSMFKQAEFHLYDPSEFHIKATPQIHLYQQLFTDETAKQWQGRNDVFFISDIRAADYAKQLIQENETAVWNDMLAQQRWVEMINPVQALLKFRLPYATGGIGKAVEYLNGHVFVQVWPPQTSTETRLVPLKSQGPQPRWTTKIWDTLDYEEKLFYHNKIMREETLFLNPFTKTHDAVSPPELINDYDSMAETTIIIDYLFKMGGAALATQGNVVAMSELITKTLTHGRKDGPSLNKLRSSPIKTTNLRVRQNEAPQDASKFPQWIIDQSKSTNECIDYSLFNTNEESGYSSLLPYQVPQVVSVLREIMKGVNCRLIIDATAHIGCDTINLARTFPSANIVSLENNPHTFKLLTSSIAAISMSTKLDRHRFKSIHTDATKFFLTDDYQRSMGNTKADLIFFDPPWGGSDYRKEPKVQLSLSGKPISDIINEILTKGISDLVILKAPSNFDIDGFTPFVAGTFSKYPIVKTYGRNKGEVVYNLYVIKRR